MGNAITRFIVVPMPSGIPGSRTPFRARMQLAVSQDQGVTELTGLDIRPGLPSLGQTMIAAVRQLKLEPPVFVQHEGVDVFYRGTITHWGDDSRVAVALDDQWKLKRAQHVLIHEFPDVVKAVNLELDPAMDGFEAPELRSADELHEVYSNFAQKAFEELSEPVEIGRYLRILLPRCNRQAVSEFYEQLATSVVNVTPEERRKTNVRLVAWVQASLDFLQRSAR